MKSIFGLAVMIFAFAISANAMKSESANPDTITQKKKRPTEAMTDAQVTGILNNMRQKRNDAEKVQVLKDGVKDRGIKVEQVMTLLNQFLTDESKIESAQYAFPYITNYKAFLKIMDLFAEERYKGRLEDFYDKNKKLY